MLSLQTAKLLDLNVAGLFEIFEASCDFAMTMDR